MARVGLTGTISQPVGPGSISFNPITGTAGAGGSANILDTGDLDLNVGFGVGAGPGGVGASVLPNLQIGQGQNAGTGAQLGGGAGALAGGIFGGPLGAAGGSLLGSAVGSLVGGAFGGDGKKTKEHNARDSYLKRLRDIGLLNSDFSFLFPDGTTGNFEGGAGQRHTARDPSKLVGGQGAELFGFETDYTNDLDYIAAMGGITLSRLLSGGKDKTTDQVGNLIGNQSLGKLGYGQDFNPDNFGVVIDNLRSLYAKSGIKSKDEFLALSNEAFSQARFNDADRAVAQQVATLIFDKDFGQASALMAGRQKGLETAAKTPVYGNGQKPRKGTIFTGRDTGIKGGVYAPIISFEEAQLAVAPAVRALELAKGKSPGPNSLQEFINGIRGGADIIRGGVGLYNSLNQLTQGGLGDFFSDLFSGGGSELSESVPFDFGAGADNIDPGFSLGSPEGDLDLDLPELDFGDDVDLGDSSSFDLGDTLDFGVF